MNLFDSLQRKHREISQAEEEQWKEKNGIQLTNSEWYILQLINYRKKLLADVCKNSEITRQGTHKLIRKLEDNGLVQTALLENNHRAKYVELTAKGIYWYEEKKALKHKLEEHVREVLGDETYQKLTQTLAADWEL